MALENVARLRLYLRDGKPKKVFTESDLLQIISETSSIEEAASLGWLLKASQAADSPRTQTIGQVSETFGQATESFKQAMSMHMFWARRAGSPLVKPGKWLELQPDLGSIADLIDTSDAIHKVWKKEDISRLDPVV